MKSLAHTTTAAVALLAAAVQASSLTPPVLPLAVRNPYLTVWLANARDVPWSRWPMFYEGEDIGLGILASVPASNEVYPLLGRPHDSLLPPEYADGYNVSFPIYLGAQFDASTTNLSYLIPSPKGFSNALAPVEVIISFLSPITPTSTLRQSIPATYLSVHVSGEFDVDLYVDLNGHWVSGDRGSRIEWELHRSGIADEDGEKEILKTWRVKRETEQLLTEYRDQAEWGTLHFSAPADVRHESGTSALLRQRFSRTGTLQDVNDDFFRGIMDEEPVFAFSKSFRLNSTQPFPTRRRDSVLFTIAHVQDPVVQYASARGLTMMRPLWASWFASPEALTVFHYLDFHTAAALASNYSTQLAIDASKSGSQDYVDILALSARQVMGATTFSGTPENPILFLKEISSNGNFQTIDVIYPSFPFFLYTNPRWLAYLLEPLIEHMLSGQYPNKYAMHDLGAHFPNATGHPDGNDEYMPVEECGNILIMGLALVNSLIYEDPAWSGSMWSSQGSATYDESVDGSAFPLNALEARDGVSHLDDRWGGAEGNKGRKQARKYIERSYGLWKQWTQYLVDFSLTPETQLSTDDFAGWLANQTNLALKGVIGIRAMSGIADAVGARADAEFYLNVSSVYVKQWEEYGLSRDGTHAKLAYHWYGSWTTLYNLFADSVLCFHISNSSPAVGHETDEQKPLAPQSASKSKTGFVSDHIYRLQSEWYHAVVQRYGLPLDSRHLYTKSDWEFFAAAVTSTAVREEIVQAVALWVNETATDRPFVDLYRTEGDGGFPGPNFKARPVVGGHFAFLALERACGGKAVAGLEFLDHPAGAEEAGRPSAEAVPAQGHHGAGSSEGGDWEL
ncbi:MAG: hypothetical protein M1832_004646 [Thelocarpon impressellum]|nr:MAG: hypothetical protein M1832_004646 [Thelocarpon impressellum]